MTPTHKVGPSVLANRKTKTVQELLPPSVLSPVEKDEPYNQTFSFSAAGPLPSTSTFSMPSTSSQDIPSTSYEMPSTSSYVGGLLPCQSLEASFSCSPVFQPSSSIPSAAASIATQEKAPAVEKLVLRRGNLSLILLFLLVFEQGVIILTLKITLFLLYSWFLVVITCTF